jgi:hypothetical protein
MTSSQHAPYVLGYTRTTMVGTKGSETAKSSESHQTRPQFRLQAATRLHEGGIASNRRSAYGGESVPGPCTHRPSHHGSWLRPKSLPQPELEGDAEGRASDWGEVVTR